MLASMKRSWLRRILSPLLGLVFAASMSVSAVQATEMAVKMATASTVDVAQHSKCPDCDQNGSGMKAMTCGIAICSAAQAATSLPQTFTLSVLADSVTVKYALQPSLVSWAHAPDPYPPRLSALN
jgi:hypothetical protein